MATRKSNTSKSSKSLKGSRASTRARATNGSLVPYGPPIREAIARGNIQEMRRVAASARKWLKDVQTALQKLERHIDELSAK
jgi:hypothetical protein